MLSFGHGIFNLLPTGLCILFAMGDRPSGVAPPPPGMTPDFDYSNPWLYTANMALIGTGLVLSTTSLLLRVYTRVHILRKFEADDGESSLHRQLDNSWLTMSQFQ